MGYKLAGFDVIGMNEIDPKMAECYIENHNPNFVFVEPIQNFCKRDKYPDELYTLDILDGSPPCSSFSMAGNREEDWGKEKKFREGQSDQILDTLFFDFIELGKKLQPKVIIAENVTGLMIGSAKEYVKKIYTLFQEAGYELRIEPYLLDASKMGVPQRRKRVFFIALRKDLSEKFMEQVDMFQVAPKLELNFNEEEIEFKKIDEGEVILKKEVNKSYSDLWDLCKPGDNFGSVHIKGHYFGEIKVHPDEVPATIIANQSGSHLWHYKYKRHLTNKEYSLCGSYPLDYNFLQQKPKYLIGMSVPPIMTAQIAKQVYEQWLSKI